MCTACETAITRIMVLFCVTDCVSMGESRRPTNASDSEVTSAVFQVIFVFQLDLSRYDTIRDAILTCARKPT